MYHHFISVDEYRSSLLRCIFAGKEQLKMQKLKSEEFSDLPQDALKLLNKNHITTLLEFLQEDVIKLSTLSKLDVANIISVRNKIFVKYSAPLTNGTSLLIKNVTRRSVPSGIEKLDTLLLGGIPVGYITEFCGLADSGKTQLCFQIAINTVRETEKTVLYIDTKGDFSATRIQKILVAQHCSHKEMASIMFKIRVVHIWTMGDLVELLKSIKKRMIILENLALIIIDSLPSLMFQFLGEENKIGLSLLNTFVNYSRYLARELNVAIICVNIHTRWIDQDILDDEGDRTEQSELRDVCTEKRNRCLGKYWQQIPMLVAVLEKYEEKVSNSSCYKIKCTVIKSNQSACENCECTLLLSSQGVI